MGINFLFFFVAVVAATATAAQSSIAKDRASLVSFMSGIVSDPMHALRNWDSEDVYVCDWFGVGCNTARDQVVRLDLHENSLRGTISPALANLSSLLLLNLSTNYFQGQIPPELGNGNLVHLRKIDFSCNLLHGNIPIQLGRLTSLEVLDLSRNSFHGAMPVELGNLIHLRQLSLSWNLLQGKIPTELGHHRRLQYIDLQSNRLQGEIPASLFCNASLLQYLDLSNNSLSGEIPLNYHHSYCGLTELRFLLLWSNRLVGRIPLALSNSTKLEWLDLESNMLSGELPSNIVSKMPQLQFLYLSYNHFVSHDANTNLQPFFASLANLSNFQELELAGNKLGGKIPPIIGNLSSTKTLTEIHMDDNIIYGSIPPQISSLVNLSLLNLSTNLLNGTIPPQLCRMENLERVDMSNNMLSGSIPAALGDIHHLGLLDLSNNMLSGSIPDSFSTLSQLRRLVLHDNQFSGTIPPSLGMCNNLDILDLSHNRISGVIPNQVASLSSLKLYLNLSSNLLHGDLPLELSKMDMVLSIDLSLNNLSGTIPSQLGNCIALESLNVSGNLLEGPLPASIGRLPYLKKVDVASNQLTEAIPQTFLESSTLKVLNFSFNKLSGKVSDKGAFSLLTINSFLGNEGLCGSIKGMPQCRKRHFSHPPVLLPILLLLFLATLLFFLPLASRLRSKPGGVFSKGDLDDEEEKKISKKELKYPTISYRQLIEATGEFCASSLIGSGQFGHVYKGTLGDNTRIAVKVLDLKKGRQVSGSFRRECHVLRRTRHRNLIRIITICSRPHLKALVLPLMPNGSLERHLYPSHGLSRGLDMIQLVKICSDVAEGLAYLHHYSPVKVVHCDLKPSNILLDDDMTALVTDFGISRLVKGNDATTSCPGDSVSFSSMDGLLCGSVGYIAPEYGLGKRASTHGDVYSYGVLLLEIVSGRRPTDVGGLDQGSSLHEWVKSQYPDKLEGIVEQALMRNSPSEGGGGGYDERLVYRDVILEFIELGLICTLYNPRTRPTMIDVAHEMARLKQYVSNPSKLIIQEEASPKPLLVVDS